MAGLSDEADEVPEGAAVFPAIPAELGVHPLLLAVIHAYVFLDGSEASVVNPEASSEAMEYLALYLQRLGGADLQRAREDLDTLVGYAKEQKWPKQYVAFLKSFLAANQPLMTFDPKSAERYSRQVRVPGIGKAGQERIGKARVTLCGCGALGTVIANHLVRAGVGFVRIVDRDFVEISNLQRQVLFDESDVSGNLPKAVAAANKLRAVNSAVTVEPIVADIDRTNILALCRDADVILDGTDNFEVRYTINDAAVKLGKPWVFGGAVGTEGQTMTIVPGETPCLRCVFEASPGPGEVGTCETAGVLGPAVAVVASYQAAEALKLLAGKKDAISRELLTFDLWLNTSRRIKIARLLDARDCPCCKQRKFEWLEGEHGTQTTSLCGRNAVQVSHRASGRLSLEDLAKQLGVSGQVSLNKFLLKFQLKEADSDYEFTVFPDGRAIIKGTDDTDKARTLYAKYIGH